MFIAKGGMVNVDQPGGKKRRAKVLNLTEKGPEIQYQDQGKEKATIPLAKVVDTVSQAADSKARLDDEVK